MESDAVEDFRSENITDEGPALNSTILDYYKKFGRKRDLEQYFSLTTAQGEVRDPTSLFWRRMKSQNESSDSGDRSRESSMEVCRISIKCSVPDLEPSSSQDDKSKPKSDTESPPIIVEEVLDTSRNSDNESVKSDDNHSQKSMDANLDASMNKALSPTSSITSQRKLEWDSLADVGYNYESDKKTSASSLSTLERLALKQQYSNNDTKDEIGAPTAHSTPVDENDPKSKAKKGKTTKIYRKDVDYLQVNMPQGSNNPSQSINVNLTKHISFNVERDGGVSVDNVKKDVSVAPEKVEDENVAIPSGRTDKEIQTSLVRTKDKSSSSTDAPKNVPFNQGIPVLINLNTLKRRRRRKTLRKKTRSKKKTIADKENVPVVEKSGEQVSEAESFEYMPGHVYNQKQMNNEAGKSSGNKSSLPADNKSSLESSAPTTDSSKGSRHSFTKDLEKSINMLKATLHKRYNDSELKEKLIKEVVQRLINSNYRDDETTTDFLSGLSFSSKKLGLNGHTTTSTSDANNTAEKGSRPKKSILRVDKFNANTIASTSQSVPNLPSASKCDKPLSSKLNKVMTSSNTESDTSSKGKASSDAAFARTSSEELYHKYLAALRREEAYKKHLKDKEMFLKQKLAKSEMVFKMPPQISSSSQQRLQELLKDLTRNNYDDGSGDASKLEGVLRSQERSRRSHSVFTLSSGNSDQNRRNSKKSDPKDSAKPGNSKEGNHYCCCPHHYANKLAVTDSCVQVNIKSGDTIDKKKVPCSCSIQKTDRAESPRSMRIIADISDAIKYVCLCDKKPVDNKQEESDNVLVYKCSRLNKPIQSQRDCGIKIRDDDDTKKVSKCSQTNLQVLIEASDKNIICIHEAVRCTQTDISINPKISDPVLTDIKIISKYDCVQLIREQYRQVSKSSINSDSKKLDAQNDPYCESDRATISSDGSKRQDRQQVATQTIEAELQSDREKPRSAVTVQNVGNFTIPIEGTHMTLNVRYGPEVKPPVVHHAIVTDAINTQENATSLREECSVGVQSKVDTIFTREGFSSLQSAPVNLQKPLIRANTHTGITGQSGGVRLDFTDGQFRAKKNYIRQNQQSQLRKETDEENVPQKTDEIKSNIYPQSEDQRSGKRGDTEIDSLNGLKNQQSTPRSEKSERRPEFDYLRRGQPYSITNPALGKENVRGPQPNSHSSIQEPDSGRHVDVGSQKNDVQIIDSNYQRQSGYGPETVESMPVRCDNGNNYKDSATCQYYGQSESTEYRRLGIGQHISRVQCEDRSRSEHPSYSPRRQYEGRGPQTIQYSDPRESQQHEPLKFKNPNASKTYGPGELQYESRGHQCDLYNDPREQQQEMPTYKDINADQYISSGQTQTPRGITIRDENFDPKENRSEYKRQDYQSPDRFDEHEGQSEYRNECNYEEDVETDYRTTTGGIPSLPLAKSDEDERQYGYEKEAFEQQEVVYYTDQDPQGTAFQPNYSDRYKKSGVARNIEYNDGVEYVQSDTASESVQVQHSPRKIYFQDLEVCPGPRQNLIPERRKERQDKMPSDYGVQRQLVTDRTDFCDHRKQPQVPSPRKRQESSNQTEFGHQRPVTNVVYNEHKRTASPDRTDYNEHYRQPLPVRVQLSDQRRPKSPRADQRSGPTERRSSPGYNNTRQPELIITGKAVETRPSRTRTSKPKPSSDLPKPKTQSTTYSPPRSRSPSPAKSGTRSPPHTNDRRPSSPYHQSCIADEMNLPFRSKPQKLDMNAQPSTTEGTNFQQCQRSKTSQDLIMNVIQDINHKYTKKHIGESQKKKAFKEIISILKYLLDTEDTDTDINTIAKDWLKETSSSEDNIEQKNLQTQRNPGSPRRTNLDTEYAGNPKLTQQSAFNKNVKSVGSGTETVTKKLVDKGVQPFDFAGKSSKGLKPTESSDFAQTTDVPCTSSESATCKVLDKIKRECEKYHQKRCKVHQNLKKCECKQSSTSLSCDQCKRIHHCSCRSHKCKGHKTKGYCEKVKKKCIAYNLIIQTSDSMISEEVKAEKTIRPMKNIIVKVPKRKDYRETVQTHVPDARYEPRTQRSRSLPNECYLSSTDEGFKPNMFTVREYLEKNRPDFCEQYAQRQNCLKMISECRANERAVKRQLLSMQVQVDDSSLRRLSAADIRRLALQLGIDVKQKKVPPKLISERDMKKHSEKIFKTLPEQVRKKEEKKKENIKKTNLLMANLFKKNLQRKTLRGAVNLSNYSQVIKI